MKYCLNSTLGTECPTAVENCPFPKVEYWSSRPDLLDTAVCDNMGFTCYHRVRWNVVVERAHFPGIFILVSSRITARRWVNTIANGTTRTYTIPNMRGQQSLSIVSTRDIGLYCLKERFVKWIICGNLWDASENGWIVRYLDDQEKQWMCNLLGCAAMGNSATWWQ